MWSLTSLSDTQLLHINSSSATPRATIRFLWTLVRSDLGTLYTQTHSTKYVSVVWIFQKLSALLLTYLQNSVVSFHLRAVNLVGFLKWFSPCALSSMHCDVCDSPHRYEEDEGEEEATQRHSTANECQHLKGFFILLAPLRHTQTMSCK